MAVAGEGVPVASGTARQDAPGLPRRRDIQGLRALCMASVVVFHAWSLGSPVGVDAFVMISTYLMTSSMLRAVERGQVPNPLVRFIHSLKRLTPPLVVVVLAAVGGGLLVLPRSRWPELLNQGIASITYWQNWRLAAVSADYFADNHALASPLMHLWYMAVQAQVLLIWPLLMAGAAVVARRLRLSPRILTAVVFAAVAAWSLTWLLLWSPDDGSTYFDTRSRLWEFAIGSVMAALAPWITPKGRLAQTLSWLSLAVLIVFYCVAIGTYPGPIAAIPLLCVGLILLAGDGIAADAGASRLLSLRPLVWLGDRSYAVYLVHWPVFVLYLSWRHHDHLGYLAGPGLIVVSLVLAECLTRLVDMPIQRLPRRRRYVAFKELLIVLISLAVGLVPLLCGTVAVARVRDQQVAVANEVDLGQHPGALALSDTATPAYTEEPIPGPLMLDADWLGWKDDCPDTDQISSEGLDFSCHYLPPIDPQAGRLVIVGDSHAEQNLMPAAEEYQRRTGMEVVAYLKGACSFGDPAAYSGDCAVRNERALEKLRQNPPDQVWVMSTQAVPDSNTEYVRDGLEEVVRELTSMGVPVVGFRDNLQSRDSLYECSDQRPSDSVTGGCLITQSDYLAAADPAEVLTQIPGYYEIDPTDLYCLSGVCPTIIGNVYVYRDHDHLSGAYSRTMASALADRVDQALTR